MTITEYQGRRFDRVPHWDERNVPFTLANTEHPESTLLTKPKRTHTWSARTVLDQGPDGACVGFGCADYCQCTPLPQPGTNTNATGFRMYHEAQDRDEWPGHDYEGSSLLGGMKALLFEKRISGYLWLTTVDEIALAIGYVSPVPIAVGWHQDMMSTDADGYVHATGPTVGGHCVCLVGYDVKLKRFKGIQSWGPDWGMAGYFYIAETDVALLLGDNGEASLPRKVRVKS